MTAQPIQTPRKQTGQMYARLLATRTQQGRLLLDAICHGVEARRDMQILFGRVLRLDARLTALSAEYDVDYESVMQAEDLRLHQPELGELPADHNLDPCGFCLRSELGFGADLVLLPSMRRPA